MVYSVKRLTHVKACYKDCMWFLFIKSFMNEMEQLNQVMRNRGPFDATLVGIQKGMNEMKNPVGEEGFKDFG